MDYSKRVFAVFTSLNIIFPTASLSDCISHWPAKPDPNFHIVLTDPEPVKLSLIGESLDVEFQNGVKKRKSVQQEILPAAETITKLSESRFVVMGLDETYLGGTTVSEDGELDVEVELIPVRYQSNCGYWSIVFWGSCSISSVEFSPALNKFVVEGWDKWGYYKNLVYDKDGNGEPLAMEDGTPLIYLREGISNRAIVKTQADEIYYLDKNGFAERCE